MRKIRCLGAEFESVAKMGAIVVSVEGGVEFCTRGVEFVMKSVVSASKSCKSLESVV